MENYYLGDYKGPYPMLSVFFKALHQDWNCSYSSIQELMLDQVASGTIYNDLDLKMLHSELSNILSKNKKEQFIIFSEHFDPNYYIDKTHEHWAQFFFWTLLHFTENEMRKRGIEFTPFEGII